MSRRDRFKLKIWESIPLQENMIKGAIARGMDVSIHISNVSKKILYAQKIENAWIVRTMNSMKSKGFYSTESTLKV